MPFFRDENSSIHYLERGRGEPVLLIHGLGCSGAAWAFQVAALQRHFRVIVPDLPGSGHSSAPRDGHSIEGYAATMWKFLDHLKIDKVNLVGFSLGGAVCQEMAVARPAAVQRLSLINSLATYRPHSLRKLFETYFSSTLVRMLGMPRSATFMAARLFPESWQSAIRDHAAAALGGVPAPAYLGMGFALARWAILDRLDGLSCSIMLIAAEKDFTPLEEKIALAEQLRAHLVVVRGSRHATPFDAVEITNACLSAFLKDEPLPEPSRWVCDSALRTSGLSIAGSIADEHALSPLLPD